MTEARMRILMAAILVVGAVLVPAGAAQAGSCVVANVNEWVAVGGPMVYGSFEVGSYACTYRATQRAGFVMQPGPYGWRVTRTRGNRVRTYSARNSAPCRAKIFRRGDVVTIYGIGTSGPNITCP